MRWRSLYITLAAALMLAACASGPGATAPGETAPGEAPRNDPIPNASAADEIVRGSGNVVSEPRDVRDFTRVDLADIGELTIEQTGTESLTIQAEDNILPLLRTEVRDGTLRLEARPGSPIIGTAPISYRLTVKDLDGITLSGSGAVTAPDIRTGTFTVTISGAGTVTVDGAVDMQEVTISGDGEYAAEDLESNVARVSITGDATGSAVVKVSDTLYATIADLGRIEYIGDPHVIQDISGAGTLTQREAGR